MLTLLLLLLQGKVRCTSTVRVHGDTTILGAGASFGEGALVTQVRREASFVALDDCYLLQFTAEDMDGLPVELHEVRVHVIAWILQKVQFFSHCTEAQREKLASLTQIEYFNNGDVVFSEGDAGDKLYILIEGQVHMRKKYTSQAAGRHKSSVVAKYTPEDELPW